MTGNRLLPRAVPRSDETQKKSSDDARNNNAKMLDPQGK